jgi:hypothetical protein
MASAVCFWVTKIVRNPRDRPSLASLVKYQMFESQASRSARLAALA